MDEDEDVVLEGSELHQHLVNNGFDDFETRQPSDQNSPSEKDLEAHLMEMEQRLDNLESNGASGSSSQGIISSGSRSRRIINCGLWPDTSNKMLEVEVAQQILKSELLVCEDEDFFNNFILSEDVMEQYKKENGAGSGGALLSDVLLFCGSLAAVAGAVFFLSERTRATAAAVAILPSSVAAVSSVRIGAKVQANAEAAQFQELVKQLLTDMKAFKQLLRKALNLIQGMEMINQGYVFAVMRQSGAQSGLMSGSASASSEEPPRSQLTEALCRRSSFIALRRAVYKCTVQMIVVYRQAVHNLMEVNPLADHIDIKDHYLAFIELENFGIASEIPDQDLSVRQLKDTIHLVLLQQSEYLRRFSLSFSEKVREEEALNKSGILKHVREIVSKIRCVTDKLSKVFEYHQALGLVPEADLQQRMIALRKPNSLDVTKKLLPLRQVYTSLFSSGLHLQNSLLKVRDMESFFDRLEQMKDKDNFSVLLPDEAKLIEWLKGFSEIQSELTACLSCLEDGVTHISSIKTPQSPRSQTSDGSLVEPSTPASTPDDSEKEKIRVVDDSEEMVHVDEVFEAYIPEDAEDHEARFEDDFVTPVEKEKAAQEKKQSQKVLAELKSVLVAKQEEFQIREAKALKSQKLVDNQNSADSRSDPPRAEQQPVDVPDGSNISTSGVNTSPCPSNASEHNDPPFSNGLTDAFDIAFSKNAAEANGEADAKDHESACFGGSEGIAKTNGVKADSTGFGDLMNDDYTNAMANGVNQTPVKHLVTNASSGTVLDDLSPSSSSSQHTEALSSSTSRSSTRYSISSLQLGSRLRDQAKDNHVESGSSSAESDDEVTEDTSRHLTTTRWSEDGSSSDTGHHSDSVSVIRQRTKKFDASNNPAASLQQLSQSAHARCDPHHFGGQLKDVASLSTPDLKLCAASDNASSPYVSLEKLLEKDRCEQQVRRSASSTSSISDDFDSFQMSAACGGGAPLPHAAPAFGKPARPAVLNGKNSSASTDSLSKNRRPHQGHRSLRRKISNHARKENLPRPDLSSSSTSSPSSPPPVNPGANDNWWNGSVAARHNYQPANGSACGLAESVYVAKNRDTPIMMNVQPAGFDARLAAAAVAKSRQLRQMPMDPGLSQLIGQGGEEYFGESSSSEDS